MDKQCIFVDHSNNNLFRLVPFSIEGPRDQTMAMVQKEGKKVCVCVCVCACVCVCVCL